MTVCIPTYNRSKYLNRTLDFIGKEVECYPTLLKSIKFVISDNCSDDNTFEIVKSYQQKYNFLDYRVNTENLGLVGNLHVVAKDCKTDFLWFVSDDDHLKEGIFKFVLEILNRNPDLNFLLLNYTVFDKSAHRINGFFKDNKNIGLNLFEENYGSLLFITACVYRPENILILRGHNLFHNLAAPLIFSLYSCSLGNVYVTSKKYIIFNPGNASYASLRKVSRLKFRYYIQILLDSSNYGYSESAIKKTIRNYLKKQNHAHLVYLFIDPIRAIKLYKFYSFKTFSTLPKNLIKFLTKKHTVD
ncbi:glycosyltransferase involved in cell wall biosynthesis [Leeuwenhoekiella aequorea]|uniref:Glycosyltransferase involved in cell wall biosynthesis n=1 Tax=Leeuwenhoekiella aequorea TaxID=283736 RepID=A0A4Q0P2I7_9FLAO|nr:glycosyltransferase involved in cell wall biosynthesis [Leeuwenhoekiella aequorea]